jgi:hypothetical protein
MIFEWAFVTMLFTWILFERVAHSIGNLLARIVFGSSREEGLKSYASMQLVGSFVTFWSTTFSTMTTVVVRTLSGALAFAFWVFVVASFFSILYVLMEYYPETFLKLVDYWNSPIGPGIHAVIILPLEVSNIVFIPLAGIFNFVVWIVRQVWTQVILTGVIREYDQVVLFGTGTASFATHTTMGVVDYVKTVSEVCEASQGARCYDPGRRMFDVITPMNDLRVMMSAVLMISNSMCTYANAPLNMILYPVMDINFAKGLHGIVNGILFTLVQVSPTRNPDSDDGCH